MNRQQAEKLLAALIFDDLDDASKSKLLAYLQSDDELREHLADMRMAVKVASDTVGHGPEPVLGQKRMKKLEKLAGGGGKWPVIFTVNRIAVAAAVFVVVAVSAVVMFNQMGAKQAMYLSAEEPLNMPQVLRDMRAEASGEVAQPPMPIIYYKADPTGATYSSNSETADYAENKAHHVVPNEVHFVLPPAATLDSSSLLPPGTTFSSKYPSESSGQNVLFSDSHTDFQKYAVTTGDDSTWRYRNGGAIRGGTGGSASSDADYVVNGDAAQAGVALEFVPGGDSVHARANSLETSAGVSEQEEAFIGRDLLGYHGTDTGRLFVNMSDQKEGVIINGAIPQAGEGSSPVDVAGANDGLGLYFGSGRGAGGVAMGAYGGTGAAVGGIPGGMGDYGGDVSYGDVLASAGGAGGPGASTGGGYGMGGGMMGGFGGMGMPGIGGRGGYGGGAYGMGGYGGGGGTSGTGVDLGFVAADDFGTGADMYTYNGEAGGIQAESLKSFNQNGVTWSLDGRVAADGDGDGITDSMYVAGPATVTGPVSAPAAEPVTGPAVSSGRPTLGFQSEIAKGQTVTLDGGREETLIVVDKQLPAITNGSAQPPHEYAAGEYIVAGKETGPAAPTDGEMVDFDTASTSRFSGAVAQDMRARAPSRETVAYDPAGRYSETLEYGWEGTVEPESTTASDTYIPPWSGQAASTKDGGETHQGIASSQSGEVSQEAQISPPGLSVTSRTASDDMWTRTVAAPGKPGSSVTRDVKARADSGPARGPVSLGEGERVAEPEEAWIGTRPGFQRQTQAEPWAKEEGKARADSSGPAGEEGGWKVPLLGDVPLIGGAFRGNSKTQAEAEVEARPAEEKTSALRTRGGEDRADELLEEAKAYVQDGKHDAAIKQIETLLALEGKNIEALKQSGDLGDMAQLHKVLERSAGNERDRLSVLATGESGIADAEGITYPQNWLATGVEQNGAEPAKKVTEKPASDKSKDGADRGRPEVAVQLDRFGVAEESADDKSEPELEPGITDYVTTADPTAAGRDKSLEGRSAGPVGQEHGGVSASARPVETEYETIQLKYVDAQKMETMIEDSFRNMPGTELQPSVVIEALPQNRQVMIFGRKDLREMVKKMVQKVDVPALASETSQSGESAESEFAEEDEAELPAASRFKAVPVNPWVMTERDSLSTFALDVDTASYAMCRRYIRAGFKPPEGAVRMEEFINYFNYHYPQRVNPTFAVHAEAAQSPFAAEGENLTLLKIGVKARTIGRDQRKAAHLVFVVDASASMGQADRLPLVQYALNLLVGRLSEDDRVTLITCSNDARLHLEAMPTSERGKITEAINAIQPSGSTNLLAGLKLGYAVARRSFSPKQVNHVVLCSDGVANVGQTEAEALLKEVDEDRKQGITITCVGVGYGSYNDTLMESLANRGDGSYVFLDSARQARRVFVEQLAATLHTVAKDARIQVEFNPQRVRRYRLIGYENRDIEDKRFRDDTIDAGEVGSGQCSTALYELELIGGASAAQDKLGTVYVRYKDVETGMIDEISSSIESEAVRRHTVESAPRFFLAAGAARFAELLRGSEHAQQTSFADVLNIVEQVSIALPLDGDVRELVNLVRKAEHLPKAP